MCILVALINHASLTNILFLCFRNTSTTATIQDRNFCCLFAAKYCSSPCTDRKCKFAVFSFYIYIFLFLYLPLRFCQVPCAVWTPGNVYMWQCQVCKHGKLSQHYYHSVCISHSPDLLQHNLYCQVLVCQQYILCSGSFNTFHQLSMWGGVEAPWRPVLQALPRQTQLSGCK